MFVRGCSPLLYEGVIICLIKPLICSDFHIIEIEEEYLEIEGELDNTLADICETERSKIKTFRMINDERPTKHMINLERKIGGYCSVSRINTPNPNYVGPVHGGIDDPIIIPKDVRLRMRNYMQTIYEKQGDVTP